MRKLFLLTVTFLLLFLSCSCRKNSIDNPTEPYANTEAVTETAETEAPKRREPVDYTAAVTDELIERVLNASYEKPKNIIFVIGDGMGPNDIAIAEKFGGLENDGLVLTRIVNNGYVYTKSADNAITDSAASGTALSTGKKTDNGVIGRAPDGTNLKTMAEYARENGKKVGIVTDDEIFGATPSAFVTHSDSRYNYEELSVGIVSFAPDLIIGKNLDSFSDKLGEESRNVLKKEYNVGVGCDSFEKILADCKSNGRKFAGFNGGSKDTESSHLADSAVAALKYLDNEKGFFLLIEGAGTDVYGHSNSIKGKISSVLNLDRAVSSILLFMEKNPDTLLIITSDHETGGVQMPDGDEQPSDGLFTSTSHTSKNVRVFALGKGSEYFKNKTIDNTDISMFVRKALEG